MPSEHSSCCNRSRVDSKIMIESSFYVRIRLGRAFSAATISTDNSDRETTYRYALQHYENARQTQRRVVADTNSMADRERLAKLHINVGAARGNLGSILLASPATFDEGLQLAMEANNDDKEAIETLEKLVSENPVMVDFKTIACAPLQQCQCRSLGIGIENKSCPSLPRCHGLCHPCGQSVSRDRSGVSKHSPNPHSPRYRLPVPSNHERRLGFARVKRGAKTTVD